MKNWAGASAIVIKDNQLLIVKSKSEQKWSIPTGGIEENESSEAACEREVFEETGFHINIIKKIKSINKIVKQYQVSLDYYLCNVTSGRMTLNDPDNEIIDIKWITLDEIEKLEWIYPEDISMIINEMSVSHE